MKTSDFLCIGLLSTVTAAAAPKELPVYLEGACEQQNGCIWVSRDWYVNEIAKQANKNAEKILQDRNCFILESSRGQQAPLR